MFSNVEDTAMCNMCSKAIPGDDVLSRASKQVNNRVFYINSGTQKVCPTCVGEYLQHQRILKREKNSYRFIYKLANYTPTVGKMNYKN